eukprot:748851-Hanusia_phi.AAC.1
MQFVHLLLVARAEEVDGIAVVPPAALLAHPHLLPRKDRVDPGVVAPPQQKLRISERQNALEEAHGGRPGVLDLLLELNCRLLHPLIPLLQQLLSSSEHRKPIHPPVLLLPLLDVLVRQGDEVEDRLA